MSSCLNEGILRAYLDRELTTEEMADCALHLAACADCHADYNELAGRSARVAAWMSALDAPPPAIPAAPRVNRVHWALPAAALALAAALAYAFVVAPKHAPQPPVANPRVSASPNPVRLAERSAAVPAALAGRMVTPVRVQSASSKTRRESSPPPQKWIIFSRSTMRRSRPVTWCASILATGKRT